LYTLRGTLVGIFLSSHPERHPGGYILSLLTLRDTLVGIIPPFPHPERHPGGYIHPYHTLRGTMVGIHSYYASLRGVGRVYLSL